MWASRLDMSRDECRKCLRCLELDAYGNMVSVLRAQGPFTEEKQKLLGELAKVLHISNERHRAEIRRAVNDEKLSVIAEQLNGPNTNTDWAIEGRRTIPLLPRLKAHTAFTGLANSLSVVIASANEKKLPARTRFEDPVVKAETESVEFAENDEKPSTKVAIVHSETNARGKKRKISLRESPEVDKCKTGKSSESVNDDVRPISPLPITFDELSDVVQVSIVTPSSPLNTSLQIDDASRISNARSTTSSTNVSCNRKIVVAPSTTTSSEETNSNDGKTFSNATFVSTNRRIDCDPNVGAANSSGAKSKPIVTANETENDTKVQQQKQEKPIIGDCNLAKRLRSENAETTKTNDTSGTKVMGRTDDDTKISRPDSTTSSTPGIKRITTSKLCLTTKPVITSSTSRTVTVNSGTTASSGPGPPDVKTTTTLTYKKFSPGKLNHHPGTKMGITLNSNKTLKINAHPNARLAAKANVIVVQKGSSRGVTLSHGGKEVLGKVIMGGKNLCLASQKSGTSVALVPHRSGTNNGDKTLAMLSTVNSNHAESLKTGAKTGNMIVLDIRQDVLDKNKVLSQFLEASGVFNSESKTAAILNSNNIRLATKNPNVDGSTPERSKTGNEPCLYSIEDGSESSDATIKVTDGEILTDTGKKTDAHGVLDAQTGIYNFETTENETDETIPTSGLDIFSTVLSSDINLENFRYVTNENEEVVDGSRDESSACSPASTVEKLNEISDS